MNKADNPDIIPVRTKTRTQTAKAAKATKTVKQPQVLDLRPGHIRAVAAMKEQEAKRAAQLAAAKARQPKVVRPTTTATTTPPTRPTTNAARPVRQARTATAKASANIPAASRQPATRPTKQTGKKQPTSAKPSTTTTTTTTTATNKATTSKSKVSLKPDKIARKVRKHLDRTTAKVIGHGKKFLVERWDHIRLARRSVVLWLSLILLLIVGSFAQTIYYNGLDTTVAARSGGTYAEGTTDKLTTVSPLHASTNTEKAASQLVYPGLLSYDDANKLRGDLAQSWSVDNSGSVWTATLKDGLTWSDGQPLSADDVVYTVKLMQDNDINSTLASTWQDIDVQATDDRTVQFTLSSPLASFDTALTFGILPKHALADRSLLSLTNFFNGTETGKIPGAGPFILDDVETIGDNSIWHFAPNDHYYAGVPELDELSIRTYLDTDAMLTGLRRGEINAASDSPIDSIGQLDTDNKFKIIQLRTASGIYAIFNNSEQPVSNSTVRQALRLGLDRNAIRSDVARSNQATAPTDLETPIASGVYDSIDQLKQPGYNPDEAAKLLEQAGWTLSEDSEYRTKDGEELAINIVTIAGTNYQNIAELIAGQWRKLGVNATVEAIDASQAQQSYLMPRNYDVLVYQMYLGADPDMFAYWSSTQIGPTGLNLANYDSRRADIALANGRTNTNAGAREARYVAFVNQWLQDSPAIALYQPSLFYAMDQNVQSLQNGDSVIDAGNRFQSINTWTVNTAPVMQTP